MKVGTETFGGKFKSTIVLYSPLVLQHEYLDHKEEGNLVYLVVIRDIWQSGEPQYALISWKYRRNVEPANLWHALKIVLQIKSTPYATLWVKFANNTFLGLPKSSALITLDYQPSHC